MQTEQSPTKPVDLTSDINLLATSVIKLSEYFTDPSNADQFITKAGWLNLQGLRKMQEHWTPHAICATMLRASAESLPKTEEVVANINTLLYPHECKIYVRDGVEKGFFGVECKSFFWFGGVKVC